MLSVKEYFTVKKRKYQQEIKTKKFTELKVSCSHNHQLYYVIYFFLLFVELLINVILKINYLHYH